MWILSLLHVEPKSLRRSSIWRSEGDACKGSGVHVVFQRVLADLPLTSMTFQ